MDLIKIIIINPVSFNLFNYLNIGKCNSCYLFFLFYIYVYPFFIIRRWQAKPLSGGPLGASLSLFQPGDVTQ